jgi:hypothetical protein
VRFARPRRSRPWSCAAPVTCRDWKVAKRFTPWPDGSFRVRLRAPTDGEAAVYDLD